MPRTILYARVSTADQTIAHQLTQAEKAGFTIDEVVADDGVSGVSVPLAERPQGKRLHDKLREGDTLVVRWVDRLGRNYTDVTSTIRDFISRGIIIRTVISSLTFDGATKEPMQRAVRDALIGFMSASAEAQAEATKEAQRAGIAHAKKTDAAKYRGRKPSFNRVQMEAVLALHATGSAGTSAMASASGLSRQTVLRIIGDPAKAGQLLSVWAIDATAAEAAGESA